MTKKEKATHDALVANLLDLRRENAAQRTELANAEDRVTRTGCNLTAVLMKIGFPEVVTLGENDLNKVALKFMQNQYVPRVEDIDIPKLQRVLEKKNIDITVNAMDTDNLKPVLGQTEEGGDSC